MKHTSTINNTTLLLPNPGDWLSVTQAAKLAGVARATIYLYLADERLTGYTIGSVRVLWRPEVEAIADALKRVGKGRGRA